ncbi:hypothetical protein TIFTF001_031515 [Ficus carica]|uniref:Putative plant transposon protein domain-containing protein n=1 Tax=Ficus carica TaxID=3494 RepID=A0AA88J6F9_FICCA|nr:hypothetical protein TIFTF001_031515 [Ficus carica]
MPCTKKVSHKQSGRKPRDTTTSYRTFQSDEAEDRCEKFTSKRSFCPEKGFLLQDTPTMGYDEFIHSVIAKHQWRQFCSHPITAVVPIVREFYAYFTWEGEKTVYVRGVQVPIDKDTINRFYGLEEAYDLHTEFAANANETWLESILENVYVEGTRWNISAQGALAIQQNNLTPQCKVRYHFLKTRLMPSTDVQMVSKDRVLLLDSIISKAGLCFSSGEPVFDTEERLSSKGAITTIAIAQIMQIKMIRENQEQSPIDEKEQGPAPQATYSRNAAASSSRGPLPAELIQSLKMLEQRMSLTEIQQYQTMEMLQQMNRQQQQYWTYAKQQDL